jgi:hypothetical protein
MLVAAANAHTGMLLRSLLLYFFLIFSHLALQMKWLICPHLDVKGANRVILNPRHILRSWRCVDDMHLQLFCSSPEGVEVALRLGCDDN